MATDENRDVVAQFTKSSPHIQLQSEHELIPFVDGVDGSYVARLSRVG